MKKILILFVLFLIFTKNAYAADSDIVINEVYPNPSSSENDEFIELFNKGNDTVTITDWKLSDTSGSTTIYVIPSATISAGGYKSFSKSDSGIALNNDGDGVVLKDDSDNQTDSMSYSTTISGKTWSRIPNGTGSFVNNTEPTRDSSNVEPPTQTPNPTNTPTPTQTPTPTNSPSNTPTPTSSPTPTKKLTPTPTTSKKITPSPDVLAAQSSNNQPPQQTGDQNNGVNLGSKLGELEPQKEQGYNWWKLLIVMGAVIITGAVGVFLYNNHIKERSEELSHSS